MFFLVGLVLTALCGVAAALALLLTSRPSASAPSDGRAPFAPLSMLEVLSMLQSKLAPEKLLELSRSVGPVFRLKFPLLCDYVVVGDPALARTVLNDVKSDKPQMIYHGFTGATAGVATMFSARTSDPRWAHARKAVAPALGGAKSAARAHAVCMDELRKWDAARLRPASEAAQSVDINEAVLRLTVRVIMRGGLCYAIGDAEVEAFLTDVDESLREFAQRQPFNPLRRPLGWALPAARSAARAAERTMALSQRILESHRAATCEGAPDAAAQREARAGSIIAHLSDNPNYADERERIADVTTFAVAGFDTTSYALTWALYELAKQPEEQAVLRKALRGTEGEDERSLMAVPEMANVVREAMRLHPSTALGSLRSASRDLTAELTRAAEGGGVQSAGSVRIAAGSVVHMPSFVIHRNPAAYARPDEFLPARWDPARSAAALGSAPPPSPDDSFPFALGRRNCVGQPLARLEMHVVLAYLVRKYEWTVHTEPEPVYFLTRKPHGARLLAKPVQAVAN